MNLLRIVVFAALGYYIFKTIKNLLLGSQVKPSMKKHEKTKDENIQEKYKDKIEDADFEEFE